MSDSDLVLERVPLGIGFRVLDSDCYRSASVVVGTGRWYSHDLEVFWEGGNRVGSQGIPGQEGSENLTWEQDSGSLDGEGHLGMDVVGSVCPGWVLDVVGNEHLVDIDLLGIVREDSENRVGIVDRLGSDRADIECRELEGIWDHWDI